jgi:hypothetical protein
VHFLIETATPKFGLGLIKPDIVCILQDHPFIFNKLNIIALMSTKPCTYEKHKNKNIQLSDIGSAMRLFSCKGQEFFLFSLIQTDS